MYVLRQQTKAHTPRADHIAAVRRLFSADQSKNCCLARTVASHKSNMIARVHLERNATQDIVRAV